MIDFSTDLYDPLYGELGVPATLTVGAAAPVTLTVIDETRHKTAASGGVEVSSVGPVAYVRMPELATNGITAANWDGALLTFNGRTWIVRKGDVLGSPNGEDLGEVRLLLKEAAVD
jgi:hypothetical protein